MKITVSGPFSKGLEYEAVLDTGFTGFLSMPLMEAIRLGLILHGTSKIILADGSEGFRLTAKGMIEVGDERKIGVVILEAESSELLLGMDFLRLFEKAMMVSKDGVLLLSEKVLDKAAEKLQQDRPQVVAPPEKPQLPEPDSDLN